MGDKSLMQFLFICIIFLCSLIVDSIKDKMNK
jgi:hypothetical protein